MKRKQERVVAINIGETYCDFQEWIHNNFPKYEWMFKTSENPRSKCFPTVGKQYRVIGTAKHYDKEREKTLTLTLIADNHHAYIMGEDGITTENLYRPILRVNELPIVYFKEEEEYYEYIKHLTSWHGLQCDDRQEEKFYYIAWELLNHFIKNDSSTPATVRSFDRHSLLNESQVDIATGLFKKIKQEGKPKQ